MDAYSRRCRACGKEIAVGTARCEACGASLRPLLLAIVSSVGVLAGSVGLIITLVWVAGGQAPELEWDLPPVVTLVSVPVVVGLLVGLWCGKYWAWIGVQIVWAFRVLLMLVRIGKGCVAGVPARALAWPVISAGVAVLLLAYVRRPSVRAFCSAGRPGKAGAHD